MLFYCFFYSLPERKIKTIIEKNFFQLNKGTVKHLIW